jgi:serine protease Do
LQFCTVLQSFTDFRRLLLMKAGTTAVLVGGLLAAAGLGATFAPAAHGQNDTSVTNAVQALDVLRGRGSHIGVSIRELDEKDSKAGERSSQQGVLVESVTEDGPAERAGIKAGDVLLEFDGERVRSVRQFTRLVQETPPGRKVQASLARDGQKVNVTIEPRESNAFGVFRGFPEPPERAGRRSVPEPPMPPGMPSLPEIQSFAWRSSNGLGIGVTDLSNQLAEYFGTKDGVLVTSVTDNSAGAKAGLKAGDVITSVNGNEITQAADLRRRIQRLDVGDEFTLGVTRDRKSLTLKGKLESTGSRRTYRSDI